MATAGIKEQWSSHGLFLLATIGAAVGLGNLWRFPFIAGQSGGGAFVIVYLAFVLLIGIPIVMAELSIGRRGQLSPISTMRKLAAEEGRSPHWQLVGWLSIFIPLLGLSYYSVVVGWSIDYIGKAALNSFQGFSGEDSQASFQSLLDSPLRILIMHTLFIVAVVLVVGRGVQKGILPIAFGQMPGGHLIGLLFFVMLFFAAFTTAIGMLEPIVSWFNDSGLKRSIMAIWSGGAAWFIGIFSALSFNVWKDVKLFSFVPLLQDKTIFDLLDFLIANFMLPLNGLLIALFAGWAMLPSSTAEELALQRKWLYRYWQFSIRYVAPVAICLIFITSLS